MTRSAVHPCINSRWIA